MPWTETPGYLILSGKMQAQLIPALTSTLTYRVPGAFRTWRYQRGLWDGTESLLVQDDGRYVVPSGLADRVAMAYRDAGLPCPLAPPSALPVPDLVVTLPNGTTLYDDQQSALKIACSRQRGLFDLAPSFGKTELIAAILASFGRSRPGIVLIAAQSLLTQTAQRLRELLREPIGVLGAGVDQSPPGTRILVAMIQSARSRPNSIQPWLDKADLLIVDEAHTITATWFPILGASQARVRIGMSGTMRDVKIPLIPQAFLGPILHTVSERQLVKAGRTSPVLVLMPTVSHPAGLPNDYDELYEMAIVKNKVRNALITDVIRDCQAASLSSVTSVYRVPHGKYLYERCLMAKLDAEYIHGSTPGFVQDRVIQEFAAGTLRAIIASTIINVGINLPNMNVFINAAAWKSRGVTRQKTGRVARLKTGDIPNVAILVDPYDRGPSKWICRIHQRVQDTPDCPDAKESRMLLERHASGRAGVYRGRGYVVREGPWAELKEYLVRG